MKAVKYTLNNDKVRYLMSTDNQLNMLIKYIENTELVIESDGFSCLIKYIIGQQISDKARETIWTRFKTTYKNITPKKILSVSNSEIKSLGLSERKIKCIKSLAFEIVNGNIDFNSYLCQSNEYIIKDLTKIKGIGKWTAEMYLIFSLGRENVLSKTDGTIKRTVKWLYNINEIPDDKLIQKIFEKWEGYETIVSTYLWKAIELNLTHTNFNDLFKK